MRYCMLLLLLVFSTAAFAQGGIALPAEVYNTPGPHVLVNGQLLKAPVKEVKGSLLLPMRAVFEALQAQVRWYPAAQQIIATRGASTVQLWINRGVAIVNEQELPLATPPILIGGATYVPLRFPAEAFGGEVKWLGTVRTAVITITPLGGSVTPGTPPAQTGTLDGVLVTKVTTGVFALLVQDAKGDNTLVQLAPNAVITRANGNLPPETVTFAALEPGDYLKITRDAGGRATSLAARYAQVKGVTAAIANNKLLLQDGSLYQLQADVRVVDNAGATVPLAQIVNGTSVTLDLTPDTTNVWRIVLTQPAATPPPAAGAPAILTVAAVNYARPVKAGETLTIQVTGQPNAEKVTASIGDVLRNIALVETAPGTYKSTVVIAANTNVTQTSIIAVMRLNGQDSPAVSSTNLVTIDTRPPSFNALIPGSGAQLLDRNPTIEAAFDDPGGSGVDGKSVKLFVNGADMTARATITDTRLSYKAQNLALGPFAVRIDIADLAGNTASVEWNMTVAEAPNTALQYVKHDAAAPLIAGQKLAISAKLAVTPVKLEWYLGNKLVSTELVKDAASGEYRTSCIIDAADVPGDYSVSARFYTAADKSQVLFAPTPVTIIAQVKTLKITSPADKSKAPAPFVITGEATPGSQVRVTVSYTAVVVVVQMSGELFQSMFTADTAGIWKTSPIEVDTQLVKPDIYYVTAELLDADGNVTETAKITLTRK